MSRRRLLTVAAVLLSVTTITSWASAECTWVLWTTTRRSNLPDDTPVPSAAYPSMAGCEQALAKELARKQTEGWNAFYTGDRAVLAFKSQSDKSAGEHYRCLPDTIDARGPKTK